MVPIAWIMRASRLLQASQRRRDVEYELRAGKLLQAARAGARGVREACQGAPAMNFGSKVVLRKDAIGVVRNVSLDDIDIPNVAKVEVIAEPGERLRIVLTIHVSEVLTDLRG